MTIFDNISIDESGIIWCLVTMTFLLISYFFMRKLRPSFVLPFSKISKPKYFFQKSILVVIIICFFLLPLNLSIIIGKNISIEKNLNIQLLFDVSLSMTADDIKPSRFSSAKSSVIQLVQNLSGYNISMITFSGLPFMWAPFTTNTNALVSKLNSMSLGDFPPTLNFVGTAIGDAELLGISNLIEYNKSSTQNNKPGIIILITDGDSNKGSDPIEATQIALKNNIPIYTLGIGKNDYVVGYDTFGSPVTTQINIPLLQQISQNSGGKFYRVLSENDFKGIFEEISNIVKSSEIQIVKNQYVYLNFYLYIVISSFLLVVVIIKLYVFYSFKSKKN